VIFDPGAGELIRDDEPRGLRGVVGFEIDIDSGRTPRLSVRENRLLTPGAIVRVVVC
jgi:hypothetical protein